MFKSGLPGVVFQPTKSVGDKKVLEPVDTCAKVLLLNKTQKHINAVKILLFIFLKFNKFIIIYVVIVSF